MDAFVNFSKATVQYSYDESATEINVIAADAGRFPAAPFNATWWDNTLYGDPSDDPKREIVRVTVVSGTTLTITRAQESTVATRKNSVGHVYKIMAGLTAKTLNVDLPGVAANPSDPASMAVATAALTTAWTGTNEAAAAEAYITAKTALTTAWTGTAIAQIAYDWSSTALATYALSDGLSKEASARSTAALSTAWAGTDAAAAAYSVGRTALDTSWVGTTAASAASGAASASYSIGKAALEAVWTGTTAVNLSEPSYGTGSPEGLVDGIQGRTHFDPVPQNLYVKTSPAGIKAGWIIVF